MTNLIEKVAELRELAAKDVPAKYATNIPEYKYTVEVLNTAPMLLDALGEIQPGDAAVLNGIIQYLIEDFEEGEHSCQMVAWLVNHRDDTRQDMIDLLRRLRDLARQMEATHE